MNDATKPPAPAESPAAPPVKDLLDRIEASQTLMRELKEETEFEIEAFHDATKLALDAVKRWVRIIMLALGALAVMNLYSVYRTERLKTEIENMNRHMRVTYENIIKLVLEEARKPKTP